MNYISLRLNATYLCFVNQMNSEKVSFLTIRNTQLHKLYLKFLFIVFLNFSVIILLTLNMFFNQLSKISLNK